MREYIIGEIQRLAEQNDGLAPGAQMFAKETGIIESKWRGKFWARWSDALLEAGLEPNSWQGKANADSLMTGLISACRHYGHFPTNAEIKMLRQSDLSIPSPKTLRSNFGVRAALLEELKRHIGADPELADVLEMLPASTPHKVIRPAIAKAVDGHVYLIKSGDFYKIGRSDELERRVKEIRLALPDAATLVHSIATDDPPGIEAYWHRRFADSRANGEWFKLSPENVRAFLRRKFQ